MSIPPVQAPRGRGAASNPAGRFERLEVLAQLRLFLRLPGAVAGIFEGWLEEHFGQRKEKVLSKLRSLRGGRLNDPRFGARFRAAGPYGEQVKALFDLTCRRLGLARRGPELSTAAFRKGAEQLGLFG